MNHKKIFGIGLGRTGTLSLTHALTRLGFKTKHLPRFYTDHDGKARVDWADFDAYDALTDESAALVYREADRRYPGSKFILTVRDVESWLRSRENISNVMRESWAHNPAVAVLHEALYGLPRFDNHVYAEAYRRHNEAVRRYFADRPQDLLVMDICGGDGWESLCPFLGKPIPGESFPRANVFTEQVWERRNER